MDRNYCLGLDPRAVKTPAFVVDVHALIKNAQIIESIAKESGAKILHALKAFSMFSTFPYINRYFSGTCSSGLYEAQLAQEYFGKEIHVFSPAYSHSDLQELASFAHHLVFNSFSQWAKHRDTIEMIKKSGKNNPSIGLRINPEEPVAEVELYDPSRKGSRLGIPISSIDLADSAIEDTFSSIDGIHFHNLCEQDFYPLEKTVKKIESRLGPILHRLKWINFGGGHHLSSENYQRKELTTLIQRIANQYELQVYLEPGEALAVNTGVFITGILDTFKNDGSIAILDMSVSAHLNDVIEMPFRPSITGGGMPDEKQFNYTFGGQTCLAGDILGTYSFDHELKVGDRITIEDMSHYTMVKTNFFNGVKHPSLYLWHNNELKLVKDFSYEDFKNKLS